MAFANLRREHTSIGIYPNPSSGPSCALPVVSDPGSLHEAGCVQLLEQLLRVDHQACMLQQTSLPRELSRQGLFLPAAGALQGHSQGTLTFCYSRSQLSDAVSQLTDCHGTVGLERIQEQDPKSGPNTEPPSKEPHYSNWPLEGPLCFKSFTQIREEIKDIHLHLFDGIIQVSDLTLYSLLVGQDEVDLLCDLVLKET